MQSVSSRIWTRVTVFISCDNNHYTTRTSTAGGGYVVSNYVPFCAIKLTTFINFSSNVMWSSFFLSRLIITLRWCLNNPVRSWWEKYLLSYNLFSQIIIRATTRIARNIIYFTPVHSKSTLSTRYPTSSCTSCLNWCKPSTHRRNAKSDKLGRFLQSTATVGAIEYLHYAIHVLFIHNAE